MLDPRSVSPGSNMPGYAHMTSAKVALGQTESKMRAMRAIGVPYTATQVQSASTEAALQGWGIVNDLRASGVSVSYDSELVALIAYLQRLGRGVTPSALDGTAGVHAGAP